jgi:hypothetical protein
MPIQRSAVSESRQCSLPASLGLLESRPVSGYDGMTAAPHDLWSAHMTNDEWSKPF